MKSTTITLRTTNGIKSFPFKIQHCNGSVDSVVFKTTATLADIDGLSNESQKITGDLIVYSGQESHTKKTYTRLVKDNDGVMRYIWLERLPEGDKLIGAL